MENKELESVKEGIESINSYDGQKRRLLLYRNIFIPINTIMKSAPVTIEHVKPHYEIIIPIGPDHHATLYLSEGAALALTGIKSDPVIF